MVSERQFLESEIVEIKRILASIPEKDILDRATFNNRLQVVEKKLKELPDTPEPETMTITFRGDSIRGTHGIAADFAGKIMNALSDVYAALVKGLSPGTGGASPESDKHRLLVTGTALGSFGFKLELPEMESTPARQLSLLPESPPPLPNVRSMLEDLLAKSLEGDDEQLADSVENAGTRALDKVRKFYEVLRDNNATFSLKDGTHRIVEYPDVERVRRAAERLKSDNIVESEQAFTGELLGILPRSRDFEFLTEENKLLHGRIDRGLGDIGRLFADWIGKKVDIKLNVRTIGKGRPRYTLLDRSDISAAA